MSQESFEKEFAILREHQGFVVRGSTIIVEILPDEEIKTKGGIIMTGKADHVKGNSFEQHKLLTGKVLMTGPGYWNEEMLAYDPLEVETGAVIILPQFATQYLSMFPGISRPTGNKIGMIKQDQVIAFYKSQAAYEEAKAKLNS